MTDLAQITQIATDMRDVFERILQDSIQKVETNGTCLYAAILLSKTINSFTDAKTVVCGGGPFEHSGIKGKNGGFYGHYWVEGTLPTGETFIADITSDQFGYEKVVVLSAEDGRSRYVPGDDHVIKSHVEEELEICEKQALARQSARLSA